MGLSSKSQVKRLFTSLTLSFLYVCIILTSGCSDPGGDKAASPQVGGVTYYGDVSGIITDDDDASNLAGVVVSIGALNDTTLADGSYTIANVPTGSKTVTATLANYVNYSSIVSVVKDETATKTFAMLPTGDVTGTVEDTGPAPILGAVVSIGSVSDTTDAAGAYTLTGVPYGAQTITSTAATFNNYSSTVTVIRFDQAQATHDITMIAPDGDAPDIPGGVLAEAVAPTETVIVIDGWTEPNDNPAPPDGSGVAGYYVYRDGVKIATINNPATRTYSDTGLTPLTTYTYTVTAYDVALNESLPMPLSLISQTAAAPPSTASVVLEQFGSDASGGFCTEYGGTDSDVGLIFHAEDINTNVITFADPVADTDTELGLADFEILDDGESDPESSFTMENRVDLASYNIFTVIAIDISTSIESVETLPAILAAVESSFGATSPGHLANQTVAVVPFDNPAAIGGNTPVAGYTFGNEAAVSADLGVIGGLTGTESSDLFGAITIARAEWEDVYDPILHTADYGYLIIISDGTHNSSDAAAALATFTGARRNRTVFTIGIGDIATRKTATLQALVHPDESNYIPLVNTFAGGAVQADIQTEVEAAFDTINTKMDLYLTDVIHLGYSSTWRDGGTHDIQVNRIGNLNAGANASIEDEFSAAGFGN